MKRPRFRFAGLKRSVFDSGLKCPAFGFTGRGRSGFAAFTLAELLIALAILGVIATFTIPKVLSSQQDGRYKAIAKETAGTISAAYSAYQMKNPVTAATVPSDLTPYMNYVAVDTTTTVDDHQNLGTLPCSGAICLRLHNGVMLYMYNISFSGTGSTNAIYFYLDPDGKVTDGTTNGPGKAVIFFLYPNGYMTDYGNIKAGTVSSFGAHFTCPTCDPPWFDWN